MVFLEPGRTNFDLSFRLFGIHVRIHPGFWLLSAVFGWAICQGSNFIPLIFIWIGCTFISILIHEMGHVFMGQFFGTYGNIVLYWLGGIAIGSNALSDRKKRIAVSFAGPLAGFLLLGVLLAILFVANRPYFFRYIWSMGALFGLNLNFGDLVVPEVMLPFYLERAILFLFLMNLFWGLLNLLPVFPLDGGQITRDFFGLMMRGRGDRPAFTISFLVAAFLALHSLLVWIRDDGLIPFLPIGGPFATLFFGSLAMQSFTLMQNQSPRDPYDPWQGQGRPWERRR